MRGYLIRLGGAWLLLFFAQRVMKDAEKHLQSVAASTDAFAETVGSNGGATISVEVEEEIEEVFAKVNDDG